MNMYCPLSPFLIPVILLRMTCYRMTITYDGTAYCGWQVQPNGTTIQELIEQALEVLLKEHLTVHGSGRTDAGVHALAQVAHVHTPGPIDTEKTLMALNGLLPQDIRILDLEAASDHFHARYSATGKEYHYHLTLGRFQDPFARLYSWHVRRRLDVSLLRQGATLFVGTHDFTSFANEAHAGCAAHDAVRTIKRLDVIGDERHLRLEFEGDGFLYRMVRNIVGLLVEVASGKRPTGDIPKLLAAKDRRLAGQAAPSHGLFLVNVFYPQER